MKYSTDLETWLRGSDLARIYDIPRTQANMIEIIEALKFEGTKARGRVETILLSYEHLAGPIIHDLIKACHADMTYDEDLNSRRPE